MKKSFIGNKGEWSELYVLAKLLTEGKLFIADEKLLKKESVFYVVEEVHVAQESNENQAYKIDKSDEVIIFDPQSGKEEKIHRSVIKNKISEFLNEIVLGVKGKRAFFLQTGNEIGTILKAKSLSMVSKHKYDLIIRSYDPRVRSVTQSNYSIKSKLGSASTLFNASQATNLIYLVEGLSEHSAELANQENSCRKRISKIYESGGKLKFLSTQNKIFKENLIRVDGYFNQLLAAALIIFYKTENRTLMDVVNGISNLDISDFQPENITFYVKHNFKKFLFYSALGMVAKSLWTGLISATGGVIVVKKDGEIVGYTPYNINQFQNYLFANTKFDSPDSGRNKYGKIYKEGNEYKINLNFQIRFID
ncbi:HpaII family restriction endonuclease [Candidatus Roizmanbacteria bacterium]|nr:HpaII family restriction endonuclease [Candidatus Roizmanbacteria bacterium]